MSAAATGRHEWSSRAILATGLSILESVGIVDFNGHCSMRLDDGSVLINTGSSVRSAITPDDFVVVGPNGELDAGLPRPPAELPLHLAVYRARPDVRAVVHGHPKWSTLLSSTGRDYKVTMAQGALLGDVPQFPSPRSVNNFAIADDVAGTLGDGRAALLRAHGTVVVADDVVKATVLSIYLELNAERQVRGAALGAPYVFPVEEAAACERSLWKQELFEKCWNYYLAKLEPGCSGRSVPRADRGMAEVAKP